jgi:hypothetical protein
VQRWQIRSCIYCGRSSTSSEHVPPKLLLEQPLPSNTITVPACRSCNQGFSLDEQYFWVLLGQISPAPTMAAKVQEGGSIDRALKRAPRLEDRLVRHIEPAPGGGANVFIKIEHARLERVLGKIALGLYFARYGRVPPPPGVEPIGAYPYTLTDYRPLGLVASTHSERFEPKRWHHVQSGVFSYIFIRDPRSYGRLICIMDFHQTMWGAVRLAQPRRGSARYHRQLKLLNDESSA